MYLSLIARTEYQEFYLMSRDTYRTKVFKASGLGTNGEMQSIQNTWVRIKSIQNQHDMGHPALNYFAQPRIALRKPRAVRRRPTFLDSLLLIVQGVSRGCEILMPLTNPTQHKLKPPQESICTKCSATVLAKSFPLGSFLGFTRHLNSLPFEITRMARYSSLSPHH
jgi:hypothetical protein